MGTTISSAVYPITITGVPGQTTTSWAVSNTNATESIPIIVAPNPPFIPNAAVTGCQPTTGNYTQAGKLLISTVCGQATYSNHLDCVVSTNPVLGTHLVCPLTNQNITAVNKFKTDINTAATTKSYVETMVTPTVVNSYNYAILFWLAILVIIVIIVIILIYKKDNLYLKIENK